MTALRTTIRVETGHPYDVTIESGILSRAAEILTPFAGNGRIVVVADANVVDPHLERIAAALPVRVERIVIPSGEASKSWRQLEALCDRLLDLEIERGEAIVALGGGDAVEVRVEDIGVGDDDDAAIACERGQEVRCA
jgi:3-dehydroquinate synthase